MFNYFTEVNWFAVAVATLAAAVLGAVWFTALLGKAYASALGREKEAPQKPAPIFIAGPFICGFFTVVASAVLMAALRIESLGEALSFGALVGLGYLAATTVNTGINPNIPRPLLYGAISGAYFFLASLLIALILVLMG